MPPAELTPSELNRYARHLVLPEVGREGQTRLKNSSVLLVGAGGLGAPAALYLAAAGVGRIGLVDFDNVDVSNLQRQVLYTDADIGRPKLDAAAEVLRARNPHLTIETHSARLTSANARDIIEAYDLVLDGADNFPTRYLVNDACVMLGKPNVHGSVFRFEGQVSVFGVGKTSGDGGGGPEQGPCYRCLYPDPPPADAVPNCAEGGVLGLLPGVIGLLQATEAVKLILGVGELLVGRLLVYDSLAMRFRELKFRRNTACPVCGDHPTITELTDLEEICMTQTGEQESTLRELSPDGVREALAKAGAPVLLDVREDFEWDAGHIEGALHIPLGQLEARLEEIPADRSIITYCKMGGRSARAAKFLMSRNRDVTNMAGGYEAWIAS